MPPAASATAAIASAHARLFLFGIWIIGDLLGGRPEQAVSQEGFIGDPEDQHARTGVESMIRRL